MVIFFKYFSVKLSNGETYLMTELCDPSIAQGVLELKALKARVRGSGIVWIQCLSRL